MRRKPGADTKFPVRKEMMDHVYSVLQNRPYHRVDEIAAGCAMSAKA
jgi:hypothetical protein